MVSLNNTKNWNYRSRRTPCIRCGGRLDPTPKQEMMGSTIPIIVQIYQCEQCHFENRICERPKNVIRITNEEFIGFAENSQDHPLS